MKASELAQCPLPTPFQRDIPAKEGSPLPSTNGSEASSSQVHKIGVVYFSKGMRGVIRRGGGGGGRAGQRRTGGEEEGGGEGRTGLRWSLGRPLPQGQLALVLSCW